MTPFYEGFTRARQTLRVTERMTQPIDQAVVRPRSVGDRVRKGFGVLRAQLTGGRLPSETAREYELAA